MAKKRRRDDGYTDGQRAFIRARDFEQCVLCGSNEKMEVHHIVPFRYATSVLKWPLSKVNTVINGITLCVTCHRGDPNSVHPDMYRAQMGYHQNQKSFDLAFEKRNELVAQGKIYWNPIFDELFLEIALRNTLLYVAKGASVDVWMENKKGAGVPVSFIREYNDSRNEEVPSEETKPAKVHKDISSITVHVQSLSQFLARNKEG